MYEQFRNAIVSRLADKLPAKLLNDVMQEIDLLSQDYDIKRSCTDLITCSGMPEIVKVYIASLAVQNCSKSTLINYKRELTQFFDRVRKVFTAVTTNDIRVFLFEKQMNGLKPSTVDHLRTVINCFFGWLVDNEYLNRNPAKTLRPHKVPKHKLPPLKQIELETFRNACQTDRERALVDFLFSTGCRISEAANANLEDLNWQDRAFHIKHGKGDKERTTYFNAESELSLKKYLSSRKGEDAHLFVSTRAPYSGMTSASLEKDIRRIRNRIPGLIGFKVTPHTFRRTMGTMAVERGCPIEQVKELLGHESLDTTMQYVTVAESDKKVAHSKYLAG